MVFKFQKILFLEFRVARVSKMRPGLVQVFTKPSELTGVIYELINREGEGFCKDNVKALMESTKNV